MTEEIRTERRGEALWITVDRPLARNAMTFAMNRGHLPGHERGRVGPRGGDHRRR